jgi:hypothetical protein
MQNFGTIGSLVANKEWSFGLLGIDSVHGYKYCDMVRLPFQ